MGCAKDFQPKSRFLQFPQNNLFLGQEVTSAGTIVSLFCISGSGHGGTRKLLRKCRLNAPRGLQFLRNPNHVARKYKQSLPDVIGFPGWTVRVMGHIQAEAIPSPWDLGFGIWDLMP